MINFIKFKNIFRTLRYRNFRLFFMGQSLSLIGTWMQHVAMGWLVYRLTDSVFLLGAVGFAGQIPTFILSPIAGVVADRFNKHRLLFITQILSMAEAFILAILTLTGRIEAWHILVLSVFLGCVNSFDIPTRQSFLVDMVEKKENLSNAIALNSLMFNAARLIGPSIAGFVIAMFGEGICFFLNGVSFFAVIISLYLMKLTSRVINPIHKDIVYEVKEGIRYALGFLPIKHILFLLSIISLTGMSYVVLMPVFARDVLKGGPETFGLLMSAGGFGALIATLYLASRNNIINLCKLIPLSAIMFAVGLALFAISRLLVFSMIFISVAGFGIMINMAACNIILQTISDDNKRGRVMSFYTMAFMGMAPLGSLASGVFASRIGVTYTLLLGGLVCVMAASFFAFKIEAIEKLIHPIYKKMGIIPEIASGMNTASELAVPPED